MTRLADKTVERLTGEKQPKDNKFHAKRTWSELCQRIFPSKEHAEYGESLRLRELAGEISNLQYEIEFVLSQEPKITITIDFRYLVMPNPHCNRPDSEWIYEDYKGTRYTKKRHIPKPIVERDFRVKLAWLKQLKGIDVKLIYG